MPRGGRSRAPPPARKAPPPPARKASSAPPPPAARSAAPPPAQQQQGGGMMSGLMGTVAQGMAFGTGSAIAHRAVGAAAGAMSGGSEEAPPVQSARPCEIEERSYFDCIKHNEYDKSACDQYLSAFSSCRDQLR
mmetsp:Transcript_51534/g.65995  ORF Transcript_51534/g.65995 Transcript_51534/m.65995 type:complete len:134 (-) Transcript_51534:174-575(-)